MNIEQIRLLVALDCIRYKARLYACLNPRGQAVFAEFDETIKGRFWDQ